MRITKFIVLHLWVIVTGLLWVGCSTGAAFTRMDQKMTLPDQVFFDRIIYKSLRVGVDTCTSVQKNLSYPDVMVEAHQKTEMIFIFQVPTVLFRSQTTRAQNVARLQTQATYDYSVYRKMRLLFDAQCVLESGTYESTLNS